MIKVLLVDDHMLVRVGLIEVIETHGGMKVVADVANGEEALVAYESHRPDVVVMDFRMPGESGADTTRRLIERHPDAKVLILSVYEGEEDVGRAVQSGARGYLSKGVDTADLLDAITSLAEDRPYFPARIAQKIRKRDERGRLTEREMTTLELLVQGMSNKEISQELSISVATVKLHISNILEKMEVSDRTQAAIAAVQRGVVHLDD
ncbi:MAG: response regulator transcription factor [Verrucomicrobiota bacterium]